MTFFGHPLHPMTVHFPIAFYLLGVLMTVIYLWRNQIDAEKFAYWSFALSWVSMFVAALAGLIDQNQLEVDDPRLETVNNHITGGVSLIVINGLLLYMRFRWPDVLSRHRWPYLGLMTLGAIVLLITAWLGGELVYRLRVGIMP